MRRYLFVHIPKAAGSSVNKFFEKAFNAQNCAMHLESTPFASDKYFSEKIISEKKYLSGHIVFDQFNDLIDRENYFVFTMLRHPYTHVISHIAWIRKLAEPSEIERFKQHPEFVQKLAQKMAKVNLGSPKELVGFLSSLTAEESILLDNVQARYLRTHAKKPSIIYADVESAVVTLKEMDYFGFVEESKDAFKYLSNYLGMKNNSYLPSENQLATKYGMSPDNKELMEAFHPLIKYDIELYKRAREIYKERLERGFAAATEINSNVIGFLDRASDKVISGWAKYEQSDDVVPLDLVVNGEVVESFLSGSFRPDLKEKFGTDCAFHYSVDEKNIDHHDEVDVRVSGTDKRLNNSPMKYSMTKED